MFGNILRKGRLKRSMVSCALVLSLVGAPQLSYSQVNPENQTKDQIVDQVVADLIASGVTVGTALSGMLPLALAAGVLTKYITTYGVMGIRAVIDLMKANRPANLMEVNAYYIYLINLKMKLNEVLIQLRKGAESHDDADLLARELKKIEEAVLEQCESENCQVVGLDQSFINWEFLRLAMDAKNSIEINKYLKLRDYTNTYHFLMLSYFDLIIVEQKLIQSQREVLVNRFRDTIKNIEKNHYLSRGEREYQRQLALNTLLRWQLLADQRREVLATAIQAPLQNLEDQNADLQEDIDKYRNRVELN